MNKLLIALVCSAAGAMLSAAPAGPKGPALPSGEGPLPQFTDITSEAGIDFTHINGASRDKHLVETMGSGAVFFDYDADGWIDIFLVDGGTVAASDTSAPGARKPQAKAAARHRLYHNRANGTFEDVTSRSGIRHAEYGMGACAGDYDGDGRPDLYITNDGPNVLYRNQGNGTFADVTATTRVGEARWSASCAFADLDRDGDLDLWVTNYVEADAMHPPICTDARTRERFYCHPLKYAPLPNTLYRNDGRGTFTDVSAESGVGALRSNGLGVVIADYDEDGWPDVFVANDNLPNFLFHNRGKLRFIETGLSTGIAVAADARTRAGMGIDSGDYDGDGRLDLVVTNLDFEMHTLHRGLAKGLFGDATSESGIGFPTLPFVGFGVAFLDVDNDSLLDIAIANGHILDNAPKFRAGSTYLQRKLLFRNTTGRRFIESGRRMGAGFAAVRAGRGLAAGDIDNDGDLDLLVANNGQRADLLRNDGGNRGNALTVRLRATGMNSDAIGARILVTTGTRTQRRDIKTGSSYLSQNDLRAHFGVGSATSVEKLEVRWPSGRVETIRGLDVNQIITIDEGKGLVDRANYRR